MSTPQLKKWDQAKRVSFAMMNARSQIQINDDLRVEVMAVASCDCQKTNCSGVQARIMPLMYLDAGGNKPEWIALQPMVECANGIFTELIEAMWKIGKHLPNCKCTKCKRSAQRWKERDSNYKEIHRETWNTFITKEDHEDFTNQVAYSDPAIKQKDEEVSVTFTSEEGEVHGL